MSNPSVLSPERHTGRRYGEDNMDLLCARHLERGVKVKAITVAKGEALCKECFDGDGRGGVREPRRPRPPVHPPARLHEPSHKERTTAMSWSPDLVTV